MTEQKKPVDLAAVEAKMNKAKAIVVMDEPFFAAILLKRKLQAIPQGTLGVDSRGQIYYNPEFVAGLSVPQCVFGLVHEVFHVVKMDFLRQGSRNQRKWNKATDAWSNTYLKSHRIGEPIPKAINCDGGEHFDCDLSADTSEMIYERIPDSSGNGPGEQYGAGAGDYGTGDDFIDNGEQLSESEVSEIEAKTKIEIAQAAQAAKMQGKLSAGIERMVEEVLSVPVPVRDILERFMTEVAKSDTSWKRPNKKYISHKLYMPSALSENAMGEMVLGIDTSGSIGNAELNFFGGIFNSVLEQCLPEKVHVVYCDAAVNHVDEYTPEDMPVKLHPYGGGGTDLRRIFRWTEDNVENPACLVILTDGYTPWPDPKEVKFPTIIFCTTKSDTPFETVFTEVPRG